MVASFHQSSELSIIVEDPVYLADRTYSQRLTSQLSSYSHEIRRIGGYWSASIRINDRPGKIEDWIENGLGRHIVVYSPSMVVVWEGFVNQITANLGATAYQIGPMMRIGNRVDVSYSTVDNTVNPPLLGTRENTDETDNEASQAEYGIIKKRYGINAATQTQAEQIRDLYANDPGRAWPGKSWDSSLSTGSGPSMTLECLGYWHWLDTFYYTSIVTGEGNVSALIADVINSDLNGILGVDLISFLNINTFQASLGYDGNETGESVVKRNISYGGANNTPYNGGFYGNREFVYEPVTTTIEYQLRLQENVGISDKLGARIKPWDVLPGFWILDPNFLIGRSTPTTFEQFGRDPRTMLIESVRYDAPWDLSINGQKLSELDQTLARRGIGGIV